MDTLFAQLKRLYDNELYDQVQPIVSTTNFRELNDEKNNCAGYQSNRMNKIELIKVAQVDVMVSFVFLFFVPGIDTRSGVRTRQIVAHPGTIFFAASVQCKQSFSSETISQSGAHLSDCIGRTQIHCQK